MPLSVSPSHRILLTSLMAGAYTILACALNPDTRCSCLPQLFLIINPSSSLSSSDATYSSSLLHIFLFHLVSAAAAELLFTILREQPRLPLSSEPINGRPRKLPHNNNSTSTSNSIAPTIKSLIFKLFHSFPATTTTTTTTTTNTTTTISHHNNHPINNHLTNTTANNYHTNRYPVDTTDNNTDSTPDTDAVIFTDRAIEQWKQLLDIIPVGMFLANYDGNVTYVNPAWSDITKMHMQDALGMGWRDIIFPADLAEPGVADYPYNMQRLSPGENLKITIRMLNHCDPSVDPVWTCIAIKRLDQVVPEPIYLGVVQNM
jgi:PAS domain-containing protein